MRPLIGPTPPSTRHDLHYRDLRDFLKLLEAEGELLRIKAPISQDLEITAFTDKMNKRGETSKALLFENVAGHSIPVLMNTFGNSRRMNWALGVHDINAIAAEIQGMLVPELPKGLLEKLKMLPKLAQIAQFPPRSVKDGPVKAVVDTRPDLNQLPVLKCWPEDGGRFITLGAVYTHDPAHGSRNVGLYRMQVYDGQTTGMHWHKHKGGAEHYRDLQQLGKDRMEVAVVLGGDPATIYSATAPLPNGIDELLLAGFIRKSPVELVKCATIDLEVPAQAEVVLEGYVTLEESRIEGPFGDHTGYYTLPEPYPVFHCTAIMRRQDPIYISTVVGKPPMEDCWLGKATERIFLPLLRLQLPEIVDMNLPWEGVFHNFVFVSIKKAYPGHAKKVMSCLWGLGQMMFSKYIVVVDADCDVQDISEVLFRVGAHTSPGRDALITEGPLDVLDHAAPYFGLGTKMGIDATNKWPGEGIVRDWPAPMVMPEAVKSKVEAMWRELGI
ncbi:MAG TPA: menaquinone biosynthesis decarboxylase [bacterium]|nr:menaquinone biosynthesis decarboxylase [bacterium]